MLKRILAGLLIGVLALGAGWGLDRSGLLDRWENLTWDWRVSLLAQPGPGTDRIRLIAVDQASLDWVSKQFGLSWPWPRQVYGVILDYLARAKASAAAFDVLFTEPSNLAGDDDSLAGAMAASPPVVLAAALGNRVGTKSTWPRSWRRQAGLFSGLESWLPTASPQVQARLALPPVDRLAEAAAMIGNVGQPTGSDQVVRRANLFRVFDGRAVPSLALALHLTATGAKPRLTDNGLAIDRLTLPLDPDASAIINYRGPPGAFARFSAAAVIQSELRLREGKQPPIADPGVFKNRLVMIGFTAPGLHDLRASPVSAEHAGLEIQATVLDNIRTGDFMLPAPAGTALAVTLILVLTAGLLSGLAPRPAWNLAGWVVTLPLPVIVALIAYRQGVWWPLIFPLTAVVLTAIGGLAANYILEGRQRRFIKRAFNHYLAPAVIDQLLKDPAKLRLGGERRELSIFFSDLESFTSISERLEPEDLTHLLNEYLTDMTDIILGQGGVVDKYEGDAIIAFWNAPLDQPDHAVRSIRAALACQRRLEERRAEFQERFGATLKMRIGINTGPVVVGNLGSDSRFDYTVLGDAANLASRLEGANKVFGTYLMVSETTWSRAKSEFVGRRLGSLVVVGKSEAVRVYEPLGLAGEEPPEYAAPFETALARLDQGRVEAALAEFEQLPRDAAARAYCARCLLVMDGSDEPDWDGVWNLTAK